MEPDRTSWRWYHCTSHTYGVWLPGDPRGFRTWKHHEHVEGDYKNPPPAGKYDDVFNRSKSLMKQGKWFSPQSGGESSVGRCWRSCWKSRPKFWSSRWAPRTYTLAKMPPGEFPRKWLGMAKKNATFAAHARGWVGNMWAKRSKPNPINDRQHHLNTFTYIRKHIKEGAWVWDFRYGEVKADG